MKKQKVSAIIIYAVAALFYLAAIINFVCDNHTSTGVVWICLGSAFLCFGSGYINRTEKGKDDGGEKV